VTRGRQLLLAGYALMEDPPLDATILPVKESGVYVSRMPSHPRGWLLTRRDHPQTPAEVWLEKEGASNPS
jgi:hypothetical protein